MKVLFQEKRHLVGTRAIITLCVFQLSLFAAPAYSQNQDGGALDSHKLLYGIHIGFTENWVDIYYSDIEGYSHPLDQGNHSFCAPGTRINVMYDMRLGRFFSLRVMPGVSLIGRTWEPGDISIPTSPSVEYKVKSVCGELPVDVKWIPFRWNDRQLYLTSGLSYSFDFTSLNKDIDDGTIQRLNTHDFRYTCGVGFDFDTRYFRLGVELKAGFGLLPPGTGYADPVYYRSSPIFSIGFNIEA